MIRDEGRGAGYEMAFLNATRPPCLQYASNGYWILKKLRRWKIVFVGPDLPPCSLAVPRDLTRCRQ
jgi:hypothetical protein